MPVAAIALITDERSRVLLVRQRGGPFAGSWLLPGGQAGDDESAVHALVREVREETGLTMAEAVYVTGYHTSGDGYDLTLLMYRGRATGMLVPERGSDVRWFEVGAIPDPHPVLRRELRDAGIGADEDAAIDAALAVAAVGMARLPSYAPGVSAPASTTITPVRVADLLVEGERMPVYVYVIDHPDARVLVDTGMTALHPAVADMDPRIHPLTRPEFDLAGIDLVVNTHLHFDHCGGNHLFAGRPIYVQRRELEDARSEDDYTIREWVDAPGARYVPVDGELELLPGVRLVPAPGHTRGNQVVVVETGGRSVVVGGDVAVWSGELDEPRTEGQLRVRALDPQLVWLAHTDEPWRPRTVTA